MLHPEIDWELCQACYPCKARAACKTRAIVKIAPDEPAYIELGRCNACGLCVLACACGAITMSSSGISSTNPHGCLPFR